MGQTETLFDVRKGRKKREAFVKTQQYVCKRCKCSVYDDDGCWCVKFDLCLTFVDGSVVLDKTGEAIVCDNNKWDFKGV